MVFLSFFSVRYTYSFISIKKKQIITEKKMSVVVILFAVTILGMVVFRIKGENDLTERLLKRLNHRGNLHCVPASLKGKYVIRYEWLSFFWFPVFSKIYLVFFSVRFTVTSTHTSNDDLLKDWAEIRKVSTELLEELNIHITDRARVHLKGVFFQSIHLSIFSLVFFFRSQYDFQKK